MEQPEKKNLLMYGRKKAVYLALCLLPIAKTDGLFDLQPVLKGRETRHSAEQTPGFPDCPL